MSLVHELAASVQCCFELFGTQSDGVLLSKQEQSVLNEISSILQPVLLRLQKQAVSVAESSELFAEDEQLLGAVVHLHRSLESLQSAVGRCKVSHWLLRVLTAEDVRRGLEQGLADTAAALQQLLEAEGAAGVGPLEELYALQSSLSEHRVTRHEGLERLGTGLYKHMEAATDAEQVVAMLRFVVREAQNLMMRRKHSRASSSSSSRRDSDASDASTSRIDQDAAAAANNNSSGNGTTGTATAAAAGSASSMDTGSSSDGSSSGGSHHKNNNRSSSSGGGGSSKDAAGAGSSSKARGGKPGDVPPGETSLTDVQLLLAVQQMADVKQGTQQLILHQILSILEELHEQKAHQLKHRHRRSTSTSGGPPGANGLLQSVPEGADDTIAAVRAAAAAAGAANWHNHAYGGGGFGSSDAAAMAAARLAHGNSSGQGPVSYGSAVAAVSGGLEELLWADPYDAAALTQLLELLLQASPEEEFVEVEEDDHSSSGSGNGSSKPGSSKPGRSGKWWGQMGAAAKAALANRTPSKTNGSSSKGPRARAAAAGDAQMDAVQRQKQERVHQMVASALEVLLRLTPMPPGCDSCFKSLARPDVTPGRSLALPLLMHCDSVKALAGCVWSSWSDVQTKAARLISILVRSEAAAADGAGVAAAVGLAASPQAAHAAFCHGLCSSGGSSASAWHGLITLLHSSQFGVAAAGAEAVAAIAASSRHQELCSTMTATQAARPLLLLVSKHREHLGAAGAAAAALHALADAQARPGMHELLTSSFTEQVNSSAAPLGDNCIAVMLSSDCLAACRAARLTAALAPGANWAAAVTAKASSDGSGCSMWGECFRAAQHVLQRGRSSTSSGGEEGSPTVAGALLLRALVTYGCPRGGAEAVAAGAVKDPAPGAGGGRSREDMSLEAMVLVVQKLQSYDTSRPGKEGQVMALIQLLGVLLDHMGEARVCGALPELFGVVVPLLEALQRSKGGSHSSGGGGGSLRQAARQLHEQLMARGG